MKPQNCCDDQPLVLKLKGGAGGRGSLTFGGGILAPTRWPISPSAEKL